VSAGGGARPGMACQLDQSPSQSHEGDGGKQSR